MAFCSGSSSSSSAEDGSPWKPRPILSTWDGTSRWHWRPPYTPGQARPVGPAGLGHPQRGQGPHSGARRGSWLWTGGGGVGPVLRASFTDTQEGPGPGPPSPRGEHLVYEDEGVLRLRLLQALDDLAGHGPHVGPPAAGTVGSAARRGPTAHTLAVAGPRPQALSTPCPLWGPSQEATRKPTQRGRGTGCIKASGCRACGSLWGTLATRPSSPYACERHGNADPQPGLPQVHPQPAPPTRTVEPARVLPPNRASAWGQTGARQAQPGPVGLGSLAA